jgi:hypothetical protein
MAWLCAAVCALAQAPPEAVAPVDWAAVNAQLVARTGIPLRQSPARLEDLVPDKFRSSGRSAPRPGVPILVPLFQGGGSAGRAFVPVTRPSANGDGSGARVDAPVAAGQSQPKTLVFPEGDTYSATVQLEQGATVTILGTRRARILDGQDAAARTLVQRSGDTAALYQMTDMFVEQTETGHSISFTRFGVAYSVEISCRNVLVDPRCSDPAFVKDLAFSMGLVGEPQRPAQPPRP